MSSQIQESSENFSTKNAFYNPAMTFNREITIASIINYAESLENEKRNPKLKILEALGATGLRSVRFAKEIPEKFLKKIICNDINKDSVKTIHENIKSHKVEHLVEGNLDNAVKLMQENSIRYEDRKTCSVLNNKRNISDTDINKDAKFSNLGYDVIDLDPFGSVTPFLDSAVQAIRDNGLLCLTCTDMAVLSGSQLQACYSYYGTWPVRTGQRKTCHEQALRTLLHTVDSTCSKYGRSIVPLLSVSVDYYIRVFVKVVINKNEQSKSCTRNGLLAVCKSCGNFKTKTFARLEKNKFVSNDRVKLEGICEICEGNFTVGGPYYLGDIHDNDFIKKLLTSISNNSIAYQTEDRIISFLNCINLELQSSPFHCSTPQLNQSLKISCTISPSKLRKILLCLNYKISRVHSTLHGFKTSADYDTIVNIFIALDLTETGLTKMECTSSKKKNKGQVDVNLSTRIKILDKFWYRPEFLILLEKIRQSDAKEDLENKLLTLQEDSEADKDQSPLGIEVNSFKNKIKSRIQTFVPKKLRRHN